MSGRDPPGGTRRYEMAVIAFRLKLGFRPAMRGGRALSRELQALLGRWAISVLELSALWPLGPRNRQRWELQYGFLCWRRRAVGGLRLCPRWVPFFAWLLAQPELLRRAWPARRALVGSRRCGFCVFGLWYVFFGVG